jgi:hypothetical protein
MPETSYPPGHVPPRPIPQPQTLNVVTIGVAQECRSGMTQMLLYFFCGKKVNSPYQEGSAEHDAFFAGCDAGRHHWRLMSDK